MLLETLKQFDWMNEPQRVRFDEDGMFVTAKKQTDFWCCSRFNFRKDDGHFFFCRTANDFCCDLNWEFTTQGQFNQCGIMLRVDEDNWFKASIMYQDEQNPMLATSLTHMGLSDLATLPLPRGTKRVWYRLRRRRGCYIASYSLNGTEFIQLRKFYLIRDMDEVKIGAYLCAPQSDDFSAVLRGINLTQDNTSIAAE